MNYGSVLGHGAYFGPDYTAEAIALDDRCHAGRSRRRRSGPTSRSGRKAAIDAEISQELKTNRYDEATGTAHLHRRPGKGWAGDRRKYEDVFVKGRPERLSPAEFAATAE